MNKGNQNHLFHGRRESPQCVDLSPSWVAVCVSDLSGLLFPALSKVRFQGESLSCQKHWIMSSCLCGLSSENRDLTQAALWSSAPFLVDMWSTSVACFPDTSRSTTNPFSFIMSSCMEFPTLKPKEVCICFYTYPPKKNKHFHPYCLFLTFFLYICVPGCRPFLKIYQAMQPVYTSGI